MLRANSTWIVLSFLVGRGKLFGLQAQSFRQKLSLRATVRHANVHVVIPTNMYKSALSFQPAPKLFPHHLSNHIADSL